VTQINGSDRCKTHYSEKRGKDSCWDKLKIWPGVRQKYRENGGILFLAAGDKGGFARTFEAVSHPRLG
jgi:hypothetical protein